MLSKMRRSTGLALKALLCSAANSCASFSSVLSGWVWA
jgi:hypothetical protein